MRNIKILFLLVLLITLSCKKESSHKPGNGWLKVTVRFNGIPSTGSIVYLSNSLNDLNNQVYVAHANTNNYGIADFGEVYKGTYTIGVTIPIQNSYDRKQNKQISIAEGEITLESLDVN